MMFACAFPLAFAFAAVVVMDIAIFFSDGEIKKTELLQMISYFRF